MVCATGVVCPDGEDYVSGSVEATDYFMGATFTQTIHGEKAHLAYRTSVREIARLEGLMSLFIPDSEVSRLNRRAGQGYVHVGREVLAVLAASRRFAGLCGGVFDITCGPLTGLWRSCAGAARTPRREEIEELLALVDYTSLQMDYDGQRARLPHAGQSVDLGGVGKGFAADAVARLLRELGVESACINLGGNVMVVGNKPDGTSWRVGMQHPRRPRGVCACVLLAGNRSVVTSGDYERFTRIDGTVYHHIIDPRTGYPARSGPVSTTILCDSSMKADILSTASFVLGLEDGMEMVAGMGDVEALFIDQNKRIFMTGGLRDRLFLLEDAQREGYSCYVYE